jgi:O-antigen ligase
MQSYLSKTRIISSRIILSVGIGLLLGLSTIWLPPFLLGLVIAGLLYLAISLAFPEVAVLAVLVLTSTVFDVGEIPGISIGIGHLIVTDFLVFIPIGIILLRSWVEPAFKFNLTPLDLPLLAFYTVAIISTVLAILNSSTSLNQSLGEVRVVNSYLTFFIVTNLVRDERSVRRLLHGLFFLAFSVASIMVIQFVIGREIKILPGRVEDLSASSGVAGVTRILPPGQSLVLVIFICLTVLIIFDRSTSRFLLRFVQIFVIGLAVLLTFNRNFWIASGLALFLVVLLLSLRDKIRSAKLAFWGILLAFLLFIPAIAYLGDDAQQLVDGSVARLTTMFDTNVLSEDSLRYRYVENEYAFPQIASHPWLGLGLGGVYRDCDRRIDYGCNLEWNFLTYIHNGHLWVILKTGFLGYFFFMWLLFSVIRRGFQNWRLISDPLFRGVVLSFSATSIGILIASIVNPIFSAYFWPSVLGTMMGINEVIINTNRDKLVASLSSRRLS